MVEKHYSFLAGFRVTNMSYHIISNLNIKSKSSEFDQLNLFAQGVFLFLWLTYLLSRKPNWTRPFLLLSLWWMTKVSCIALTETGTRVELRLRKIPRKTLADNKFTRYWCNFCWIKSEKMVVFDIGYSYSHVCLLSRSYHPPSPSDGYFF